MCKATCSGADCNDYEAKDPNLDSVVPICNVCQVQVKICTYDLGKNSDRLDNMDQWKIRQIMAFMAREELLTLTAPYGIRAALNLS